MASSQQGPSSGKLDKIESMSISLSFESDPFINDVEFLEFLDEQLACLDKGARPDSEVNKGIDESLLNSLLGGADSLTGSFNIGKPAPVPELPNPFKVVLNQQLGPQPPVAQPLVHTAPPAVFQHTFEALPHNYEIQLPSPEAQPHSFELQAHPCEAQCHSFEPQPTVPQPPSYTVTTGGPAGQQPKAPKPLEHPPPRAGGNILPHPDLFSSMSEPGRLMLHSQALTADASVPALRTVETQDVPARLPADLQLPNSTTTSARSHPSAPAQPSHATKHRRKPSDSAVFEVSSLPAHLNVERSSGSGAGSPISVPNTAAARRAKTAELEAQLARKLAEVKLLSHENKTLNMRLAILETAVQSQGQILQLMGKPVPTVADEQQAGTVLGLPGSPGPSTQLPTSSTGSSALNLVSGSGGAGAAAAATGHQLLGRSSYSGSAQGPGGSLEGAGTGVTTAEAGAAWARANIMSAAEVLRRQQAAASAEGASVPAASPSLSAAAGALPQSPAMSEGSSGQAGPTASGLMGSSVLASRMSDYKEPLPPLKQLEVWMSQVRAVGAGQGCATPMLPIMSTDDFRIFWKSYLKRVSALLLKVEALQSDPMASVELERVVLDTLAVLMQMVLVNPFVIVRFKQLNLETGATELPPASHWLDVARGLSVSPSQLQELSVLGSAFVSLCSKLLAEVQSSTETLQKQMASRASEARRVNLNQNLLAHMDMLTSLRLVRTNFQKIHICWCATTIISTRRILSPKDFAKICVQAYPFFPDGPVILRSVLTLAQLRPETPSEDAPAGADAL